jgi:hypothetical protein
LSFPGEELSPEVSRIKFFLSRFSDGILSFEVSRPKRKILRAFQRRNFVTDFFPRKIQPLRFSYEMFYAISFPTKIIF